jgi:hypothetical protein
MPRHLKLPAKTKRLLPALLLQLLQRRLAMAPLS